MTTDAVATVPAPATGSALRIFLRRSAFRRAVREAGTLALFGLVSVCLVAPMASRAQSIALQLREPASAPARQVSQAVRVPDIVFETVMPRGPDIDGDGDPDFVNPTGGAERGEDGFGSGAYHASRDGGARRHSGVDIVAKAGQAVVAPISGYVTRIGLAYAGDDMRYVELSNPALGLTARVFYVAPSVSVGQTVRLGDRIGRMASLQDRYAGITDHVHLELSQSRRGEIDPTAMIPKPIVRLAMGGRRQPAG